MKGHGRFLALAIVLAATLIMPSGALALSTAPVTVGATGYGTVTGGPGCTTAASNGAGHESDCAPFNGRSYEHCTAPDSTSSYSCTLTLTATTTAGWAFDHWTGDCMGPDAHAATCVLATFEHDCSDIPCVNTTAEDQTAVAHFTDTRAPTVIFTQAPAQNSVVFSDTAEQEFDFHTDEDGEVPSYRCGASGGNAFGCSSPHHLAFIPDGIHTYCVQATDASGLVGTPACRTWEQESSVAVSIDTKPAHVTQSRDATFTYSSAKAARNDGATLTYQCKVDSSAYSSCDPAGLTLTNVADGVHTFTVQATFHGPLESAGTTHTATSSWTWTVDTTGPELEFTGGPDEGASFPPNSVQTFEFSVGDATTSIMSLVCTIDGGPFGDCTSTHTETVRDAAVGEHILSIEATDVDGNTTLISRSWKIVAPDTSPGTGGDTPGTGGDTPGTGGDTPGTGGDTPGTGGDTPGTGGQGSNGGSGDSTQPRALSAKVAARWRLRHARTLVRRLRLTQLPAGTVASVTCHGTGCTFTQRSVTARAGAIDLTRRFRAPLRAGTVITITLAAPGYVSRTITYTTRRGHSPRRVSA